MFLQLSWTRARSDLGFSGPRASHLDSTTPYRVNKMELGALSRMVLLGFVLGGWLLSYIQKIDLVARRSWSVDSYYYKRFRVRHVTDKSGKTSASRKSILIGHRAQLQPLTGQKTGGCRDA